MRNPLSATPFLFLLLPLLVGILLQYYFRIDTWSIAFLSIGGLAILLSFLIKSKALLFQSLIFSLGTSFVVIGIGIASTDWRMQQSEFTYSQDACIYKGVILDIPQEKPNSMAYKVKLTHDDKQIVCYLSKESYKFSPGDIFLFESTIQPFRNAGNPDDFDYAQYMFNQGFSGSTYIAPNHFQILNETDTSLKVVALRCRMHVLGFYQSLGFDSTEYSILSALTLGYQDALSDDMKQAFRTTGTVHVLSVSGLHVGIIYVMISFLLGLLNRFPKLYWLRPIIIIVLLWVYAFITGLPPSVIRASAMLTVFCVSEILRRKSFSTHGLYIAAFFMLVINPLSFFDIGFQLSFISVLSILYLQPRLVACWKVKNRYLRYVWQMMALSLVAQLATFPLCLYYFGTFPTYFFITNLVIVPIVSFITYAFGGIILAKLLSLCLPTLASYFYFLPVLILQFLVKIMTVLIEFFASLPFSLIQDVNFSFVDLILLSIFILGMIFFQIQRKAHALIIALTSLLIILVVHSYGNLSLKENRLIVYNRYNYSQIEWNVGSDKFSLTTDNIGDWKQIRLNNTKLIIISTDKWIGKEVDEKYEVDYLILTNEKTLSLNSLTQIIIPSNVVLDASLSAITRRRLQKECRLMGIPCYDVAEKGALSIIF